MDPFTALSLAGVIVQFIELGIKLTVKSSEICSSISGETDANQVMNSITTDLNRFTERLNQSLSSPHSTAEKEIAALARECAAEAHKLMVVLNQLQAPGKGGKLPALVPALKGLWKKKEIEEISQRLNNFRGQITLRLVALINDKNSSMTTLLLELVKASSTTSLETSTQLKELQATMNQLRDLTYQASKSSDLATKGLDMVPGKLNSMVKIGDRAIEAILRSLQFESMRTRESTVAEAHTETFEWLFTHHFDFHKWLLSHAGIFWISGKPGSGKSTLMKFVSAHTKTKAALQSWAGNELLIIARFYFWNAGTPMQKSLQGLLQSLLYQIFQKCPLLIPIVAPERWGNAFNLEIEAPWTWQETIDALDRFIKQKDISCKTCLFIDGLDEFDGDHSKMVSLLFKISDASKIKLCLASRPYNVFEEAYSGSPDQMLRLQDLTRDDIRRYTYDNLETHRSFSKLKIYDSNYSLLVEEIVNKADGVFLWVYLVVRSLKDGLTNADTVSILQKRLRQLPSDLEQYFTHILTSIDEVYWEGTAKAFQMATSASHLLPIGVLSALDEDDPDVCLIASMRSINQNEYEARIRVMEKRLNARCKGLLEVRNTPGHLYGSDDYNGRHLVDFLHRTVRDFLRLGEVDSLLRSRLKTPFDVDLVLCQGFLIQLKQFITDNDPKICRKLTVEKALEDLIYHARRLEVMTGNTPTDILDEALRATKAAGTTSTPSSMFYSLIVQHGLSQYLEYRLRFNNPQIPPPPPVISLLTVALTSATLQTEGSRYDIGLQPKVIQILLDNGANPNEPVRGFNPPMTEWTNFVRSSPLHTTANTPEACVQTFTILLKAGAERYDGLLRQIENMFSAHDARLLGELIQILDANTDQPGHPNSSNTITSQNISEEEDEDLCVGFSETTDTSRSKSKSRESVGNSRKRNSLRKSLLFWFK